MYCKDKGDGLSKEGSGRVGLYKLTKLNMCYTIECNYNSGNLTNKIQPKCNADENLGIFYFFNNLLFYITI